MSVCGVRELVPCRCDHERVLWLRSKRFRRFFVAFGGLALVQMLTGCILDSQRPPLTGIPTGYGAGQGDSAPPALDWWRGFNSAELTGLHRGSPDRQLQHRRRDRAHHAGRRAGQDRRRAVAAGLQFDGTATRLRPAGGPVRENYRAWLTASYEIDFWGKNRAALIAAQESAAATRFAKEVVVLSTVVSVGTAYLQVLVSQDRIRIARQNLAAATRVLDLIKQRFAAGTASQLDIAQQESVVATVRANIPLFDQTLRQNIADAGGADRAAAGRGAGSRAAAFIRCAFRA